MNNIPEHYAAPPIEEAVPPTERVLLHLIDERGESEELLFSLGNVVLRKGRPEEALKNFKRALELNTHSPRLRTNIGVAYMLLGNVGDAEQHFRQALMQEPNLEIPLLHLGTLLEERGDRDDALKVLEKYLKGRRVPKAALLAGRCAAALGDEKRAEDFYRVASADGFEEAIGWLLAADAKRARAVYERNDVIECCRILNSAYERAPGLFSRDQRVQDILRELSKLEREKGSVASAANNVRSAVDETAKSKAVYVYCIHGFLEICIVPEVFVDFESLEQAEKRWNRTLQEQRSYPYGNYRRGIVYAFEGKFTDALNEFDICRGKLPEKKQKILKLYQVIDLVTELRDMTLDIVS